MFFCTQKIITHGGALLKCGLLVCSDLLPLVVVEDRGHEEEDGMAEEPQAASLQRTRGRPRDHLTNCRLSICWCVCVWGGETLVIGAVYLGEAEVKVPLQGAPLSGGDLVEDRGQQEGQDHSQSHEEETRQTLLGVVAVMFAL